MTKNFSNSVRAGLLGIALASAGATSSFALVGDVVVNGSFESGNTGFTSTYGYVAPGGNVGGISGNLLPEEAYTVHSNPNFSHSLWGSFADHTAVGTQMLIVNGGNSVTDFVWRQTVNVTPGLTYFFEAWLANVYPDSPANLNFVIVDGATTINLGPAAPLGSPVGIWNLISSAGYVPINSSVTLRLDNANTVRNGNDFAVDDISFATERQVPVVPEVSTGISAGAFALIGGLIVLRRRKAAQAA